MKTAAYVIACFLTLFLERRTHAQKFTCAVKTSSGEIVGTLINFENYTVKQYLGIPFARPPVGELRFQKPQPVDQWDKTLVADTNPPACIQYLSYPFPWYDFKDGSEDCLHLNIWVPTPTISQADMKIPVFFWIHGGGFTAGSIRDPLYNGKALAAIGEVVVVTVSYRLAAFGFLNSGAEAAPGNVGMYDMLEALKWVNKNIAAFGGDPDQVTLAGESAGSMAVGLLCVSPLAEGLFKRVIMESGSPAYLIAENSTENLMKSQRLAKAVGCADEINTIYVKPDAVVDCLTCVDALELAKTENSFHPTSTVSLYPNYGDEILPLNARIELINGNFQGADVLIGNNHDEGPFFVTSANPEVFGFFGHKDPKINKTYGESMIRKMFKDFSNPDAVVKHYLGKLQEDDYDEVREQVYTAIGDFILLCPTVYFAESYSKAGNKVFYYFFEHRPSTTPWAKWMGAMHFSEIQFVFGVPLQQPSRYTKEEVTLSRNIIRIWSNFAKYGNPGGVVWPNYSRQSPTYVKLDTRNARNMWELLGEGPHTDNCNFFRKYFGFV